ncbi:MAG: helix-turn-helix transcriptional regulator [Porticoccaceae bacterium]
MSIFEQCEIMNRVHGSDAVDYLMGKGVSNCTIQRWSSFLTEYNTGELEYPILALKLSGHAKIRRVVNGQALTHDYVIPGDIIIVPSMIDQRWSIHGQVDIAVITFENSQVCHFLNNLYARIGAQDVMNNRINSFSDSFIYSTCQHLLDIPIDTNHGFITEEYLNSVFRILEMYILNYLDKKSSKLLTKKNTRAYFIDYTLQRLNFGLNTNIYIEDIARELRVSPSYLTKKFKEDVGIPPHQFLLMLRIRKAKQLLAETDVDVASIADECGFSHQGHLTRYFTKDVGMSPLKFRQHVRKELAGLPNV